MRNNTSHGLKSFDGDKTKYKHFGTQMKKVFKAFQQHPKTMLMVSIETGILRANLCRYVAVWRKENRIQVVRKGVCPISKEGGVQFLTTNPEYFIKPFNTTER